MPSVVISPRRPQAHAGMMICFLANHEASGYYDATIGDAEREWVAEAQRKVAGRY